jgi:hypothetical protein
MSYDTGAHTVFYHRYHIVWITKYRFKVSIGIETGPLIGAQKGPLCSDVSWPEAA